MSISRQQVEYIAKLARIELDEGEVERFQEDLSAILDYVEKLEELDTEEVEPTTHAVLSEMAGRADEREESLSREEVLENAPDSDDGQFRVPKVVE